MIIEIIMGEVIKKVLGFAVAALVGYGAAKVIPITVNDGTDEPLSPPLPQRKVQPVADVDMVWRLYKSEAGWDMDEEPKLEHPDLLKFSSNSLSYQESRNWSYRDSNGHLQAASDVYTARMSWSQPPSEINYGREDGLIFNFSKYVNYEPVYAKENYNRSLDSLTPKFEFFVNVECEYVGNGQFQYGPGWQYGICNASTASRHEDFSGVLGLYGPSPRPVPPIVDITDGNWELVIKQHVFIYGCYYVFTFRYRLEEGRSSGVSYYTLDDWIDYWGNVEKQADDNQAESCARFKKEAMESWKEANGLVDKIY